jgi:hypothetical protein
VSFVGLLLDATGSWELSMHAPLILMLLIGNYVYVAHCDNRPIDFDARAAAEGGGGDGKVGGGGGAEGAGAGSAPKSAHAATR